MLNSSLGDVTFTSVSDTQLNDSSDVTHTGDNTHHIDDGREPVVQPNVMDVNAEHALFDEFGSR